MTSELVRYLQPVAFVYPFPDRNTGGSGNIHVGTLVGEHDPYTGDCCSVYFPDLTDPIPVQDDERTEFMTQVARKAPKTVEEAMRRHRGAWQIGWPL